MKKRLRPIFFAGTGSDVGKSVVNAGFCRVFKQDGYSPAPFKAQNMSLNSFATPEGLEIGRAQAVQAEACAIACHTDMNPILLKPTSDKRSQVVLHGKPIGNQSAVEYFRGNLRNELFSEVLGAFQRLNAQYNPVVMEGAGSISEINLRDADIVNMRMALAANAAVYLVADIDRGGVFASVYGTLALLKDEEKRAIKGIIINKFRGDLRLFDAGKRQLEDLCGVPVVGIIPYFKDIYIEQEDSVMLETKYQRAISGRVNIAVVLLRHLSNFTDFNNLERYSQAHVYYTNNVDEIENADIVLIPGSKNTIADLADIRANGVARAIVQAHKAGKTVIGICGGYQMMGQVVEDPHGVEGRVPAMPGLGLLPVKTIMTKDKTTVQCTFAYGADAECQGYEIHMGQTVAIDGQEHPLVQLADGRSDGYRLSEICWGSYIHGILDNSSVIESVLKPYIQNIEHPISYADFKELQYNRLADWIRHHVDMKLVYSHLLE